MTHISTILFSALFAFGVSDAALARGASPKDSFNQLNQCIKKHDTEHCREMITASSTDLYDRFMSYGLMECLPTDAAFVSQQQAGDHIMIRASTDSGGKKHIMRLLFVDEEGAWKLDIPESLHAGMGDNWEQKLNTTEQIYLMLRQQMGDQLNCSAILNIVKK